MAQIISSGSRPPRRGKQAHKPGKPTPPPSELAKRPLAKRSRRRRTNAEIEQIKRALVSIAEAESPCTVRQLFYRIVSMPQLAHLVPKTEASYDAIGRYCVQLREDGRMLFRWIADNTRWTHEPVSHDSMTAALEETRRTYRRQLWNDQPVHVELWCEKDALSGVLYAETSGWRVPLFVSRGFASMSYLHAAGRQLAAVGKPAFVYLFTDHDPSGLSIAHSIERGLRRYCGGTDLTVKRVAVTEQQIEEWQLPTRPTKQSDSRAKNFKGRSVDLDAIPPLQLRKLAAECITRHLCIHTMQQTLRIEQEERKTLDAMVRGLSARP